MIRKIWHYFREFIVSPQKASGEIAGDRSGLWVGLWWVITIYVLYSISVLVAYLIGHEPVTDPFLPIPFEKWYLVQTFTTLPVGMAGFLSYSGLAYLLSKAAGGKGGFDQTFASQAFTIHIPVFIFMWIPETFVGTFLIINNIQPFPWPDWVEYLRVFVLPFMWIFIMSTIALSRIHEIQWWKSTIFIIISLIPTGGIMAVFIR